MCNIMCVSPDGGVEQGYCTGQERFPVSGSGTVLPYFEQDAM